MCGTYCCCATILTVAIGTLIIVLYLQPTAEASLSFEPLHKDNAIQPVSDESICLPRKFIAVQTELHLDPIRSSLTRRKDALF